MHGDILNPTVLHGFITKKTAILFLTFVVVTFSFSVCGTLGNATIWKKKYATNSSNIGPSMSINK